MLGIERWKEKLREIKIGVAGDFCLDRNNTYTDTGLESLEFDGIPIERVVNPDNELAPGGAGNVAFNLKKLGVNVVPFGVRGTDFASLDLITLLERQGIPIFGLIPDLGRRTPKYEKFYVDAEDGKKQTRRLDTYNDRAPFQGMQSRLLEVLEEEVKHLTGFYIADQLPEQFFPCITPKFRKGLAEILTKTEMPVMIDSRERIKDWAYPGFVLKPNFKEFKADNLGQVDRFVEEHQLPFMYVTMHEDGAYLFEKGKKPILVSTLKIEEPDTTGCGDAFGAASFVALKVGETPLEAAKFGNAAAYFCAHQIGMCGMPDLEELFKNYRTIYGDGSRRDNQFF